MTCAACVANIADKVPGQFILGVHAISLITFLFEIKENLVLAFGYNTLAIPLAMGILYPFFSQVVSPAPAALLMATSSVSVTLNTLRMRSFVPAVRRVSAKSGRPQSLTLKEAGA